MPHTLINPTSVAGGHSLNVADLLAAKHCIPNYQRDFVWTRPQVEQLWDDLIAHYKKYTLNDELKSPDGYFLGAMVAIYNDGSQEFEVVDGQQRLTTLSTVISVLYDALEMLDEGMRDGYEEVAKNCLAKFVGGSYLSNIQFSDEDLTNFFLESVRLKKTRSKKEQYWVTPPASQFLAARRSTAARVREALVTGYEKLNKFLGEAAPGTEQKKRLISFFRVVTECVVVLRISAQSHTNAYAIFESLNNRGVRLSQADLIKNELLKNSSATSRSEVVEHWNLAKEFVESGDFVSMPEFLHLSYLSRFGPSKANALLMNVTDKVEQDPSFALTYAGDIEEDAKALDMLTEHFQANWTQETQNMLRDLRHVLSVKLCYPMLIAAYRKHAGNPAVFERYVRLCMNFVFRYMKVLGGGIEPLARISSEAAEKIRNDAPFADIAAEMLKEATDQKFKDRFATLSVQQTKLAYFVVYYLERQMLHGTLPLAHGDAQNLEHIMPKTPTSTHWPDATTWRAANAEDFDDFLWRIGNLLPLPATINKSLKNREISFKLKNGSGKEYEADTLSLASPKKVRDFLDGGMWTRTSIDNRQKALANEYACDAWALS